MATENKDFVVKNGLVVQGAQGTIDGSYILTEQQKSQPNGVATLDSSGNVPSSQLGNVVSLQGAIGVQGTSGAQGIQGLQGSDAPGNAFYFDSSLPSETAVSGDRWFNPANGVFYTWIEDGDSGQWVDLASGYIGIQGIQGPAGTGTGEGSIGIQGIQGIIGPQGIQGILGIQGLSGIQGFTGIQGTAGSQGIQGTLGIQGILGAQGTTGAQGATGIQGVTGVQGIIGTQGIQGITGTGAQGIQGIQGIQGSFGIQGTTSINDYIAVFSRSGDATITAGTMRWRFPVAATIVGASAAIGTAPTGSSLIIDVNKNGTTIYTTQGNRPTISAGTNSASETSPNVTSMAIGDYLTVDIDQIGSTVAGSDLTVFVRYRIT